MIHDEKCATMSCCKTKKHEYICMLGLDVFHSSACVLEAQRSDNDA